MQCGQRRTRFGALFLDEAAAGFPVQAQRITGAAAAVQGLHLEGDERLVERPPGEQVVQLADQVSVQAQALLCLDPGHEGRPALFLEGVAHPADPVTMHPGQRGALPQRSGLTQQQGRVLEVVTAGQRVRLAAQPAEPVYIDRLGISVEHIPAGQPVQLCAVAHSPPQGCAEPGHIDKQALPGLRGGAGIPQPVDEGVG